MPRQLKPSPMSPLNSRLTDEQQDELWEMSRRHALHELAAHCRDAWGVETSVSALQRWISRQRSRRTLLDIREAKRAAAEFERGLRGGGISGKEGLAMSAAFWNAATARDAESIERLGQLVLRERADARAERQLERRTAAERRADRCERDAQDARAALDEARAEIERLRARLAETGRAPRADPGAAQAALDRALGVGGGA